MFIHHQYSWSDGGYTVVGVCKEVSSLRGKTVHYQYVIDGIIYEDTERVSKNYQPGDSVIVFVAKNNQKESRAIGFANKIE